MGPFWTALVAAFVAAYPGAELTGPITQGGPWPFQCTVEVSGGGVFASGWGEMPNRWDPEPIEDTCDRAALDMLSWWCESYEDTENPPVFCQF